MHALQYVQGLDSLPSREIIFKAIYRRITIVMNTSFTSLINQSLGALLQNTSEDKSRGIFSSAHMDEMIENALNIA